MKILLKSSFGHLSADPEGSDNLCLKGVQQVAFVGLHRLMVVVTLLCEMKKSIIDTAVDFN